VEKQALEILNSQQYRVYWQACCFYGWLSEKEILKGRSGMVTSRNLIQFNLNKHDTSLRDIKIFNINL
jgi:hypothetical protein